MLEHVHTRPVLVVILDVERCGTFCVTFGYIQIGYIQASYTTVGTLCYVPTTRKSQLALSLFAAWSKSASRRCHHGPKLNVNKGYSHRGSQCSTEPPPNGPATTNSKGQACDQIEDQVGDHQQQRSLPSIAITHIQGSVSTIEQACVCKSADTCACTCCCRSGVSSHAHTHTHIRRRH